jgi:putative ABC transport system permease protein
VSTSADLATLREALDARLGEFGDEILLLTFAATAGIVAVLLTALVLMRRKDYGRRRALGASRSAIVALVELQIAMAAATGVALGSGLALASLAMRNQELPPTAFVTANGVLLVSIAMTSGLPPSLIAASREPVRELRVP